MWQPTAALRRALLLPGLVALAGVVLGRPDVVLLAAPFALGTAWALRQRPRRPAELAVGFAEDQQLEGADTTATVTAGNPDSVGYDLVVVRTRLSRWLSFPDADRPYVAYVPPRQLAELELSGPARRWGRHRIGPAHAVAYTVDALLVAGVPPSATATLTVYPVAEPFRAGETMPRSAGLVGTHRSRQPGTGGELAGVRLFQPGDRLRRVDWRVSLRTGEPHVAATLSDRDAELVLVLDALTEVGSSGGFGGRASVLDVTVRAAAAIAEHYLHRGDRVSLVEYGRAARRLRPASGRRQYLTVLEWLLDISPGPAPGSLSATGPELSHERMSGSHLSSPEALLVVLTPLVVPEVAGMLARLVRSGRYVVAVDTLPEGLPVPQLGPHADLAYRLWRLERENTVGALREHGVPLVSWAAAGGLDQVLRRVARMPRPPAGRGVAVPGVGA